MQYTQAQIDRANAVSLEDFLRTQGETLIKSGREYRWKEHDSLTVRGNKWFRHSQSKGGYPIDFVMEFYGKSFPEAVQLLTGESGEGQSEAAQHRPQRFTCPCTTGQPTEQSNISQKAEVSTRRLLRLFFFPGIFTRTQSGTMLCLSAETEAVHRDTPMCEERQTHSDRTLPGLTNPIRSDTRVMAISSLSLKRRLTCYRLSAFIRRIGRQEIILPWAAFLAKPLTVFFLSARTPKKCSSALTATPQEMKPAHDWHSPFPARSRHSPCPGKERLERCSPSASGYSKPQIHSRDNHAARAAHRPACPNAPYG